MKVKIAACDDSKIMLRQIAGYLEQLQEEIEEEIVPCYFSSGEEVIARLAADVRVLLLDISMEGMNGIECARILRERGIHIPIIFITSMAEYSLEGYAVHAFGFLVKPVTYTDFSKVVKEALASSETDKPQSLLIRSADGMHVIDPQALLYAEVYKHDTSFVLQDKRIDSTLQLSSLEPLLLPYGFFRCHRGYLISFRKVAFIGKDSITMANGDEVPLSKHRRKEFLDAYGNFMGVHLP